MRFILALNLLLVAGLELGATGSLFGGKREKPVDFKGLNKFLVGHLAGNDDLDTNLVMLRADVGSLTGGVRRAADIILELVRRSEQVDPNCDDHLLAVLNEASEGHLRSYGSNAAMHRVEQLVRPALVSAVNLCSAHVHETLKGRLESLRGAPEEAQRNLLRFHELMNSADELGLYDVKLEPISCRINDYLAEFSKADQRTKHGVSGKSMLFEDRQVFDYALDRYLVEPCKQFAGTFGDLLRGAGSLKFIEGELSSSFSEQGLELLKPLAITNGICKHISHLTGGKRAEQFRQGLWTFDHKEGRRMPKKTLIEKILF